MIQTFKYIENSPRCQTNGCWNQVSEWAHGSEGTADCSGTIGGESAWKFRGDKPNPYDPFA